MLLCCLLQFMEALKLMLVEAASPRLLLCQVLAAAAAAAVMSAAVHGRALAAGC
jgi:hypothetical protein